MGESGDSVNLSKIFLGAVVASACGLVGLAAGPVQVRAAEAAQAEVMHLSESFARPTGQTVVESKAGRAGALTSTDTQLAASEFFSALHRENPAAFVSFGLSEVGGNEYWLSWTVEPSPDLLLELQNLPFKTAVSWGFPASADQLQRAADELTEVVDADPRVSELRIGGVTTPDSQGIEIRLITEETKSAVSQVVVDAIERVNASGNLSGVHVDIPVVVTEGPVGFTGQAQVKGGHATNCYTTGFTASYGGDLGFMTAAHGSCSALNIYDSASGIVTSASTPRRPLISGGRLDVWFARTLPGHTTTYRFADSANSDIVATGVAAPFSLMAICKYGLVTGRHCGQDVPLYVTSNSSFCSTAIGDGITYCRLWEVNRRVTEPGDSGGPWFLGQSAVGLTSGATTTNSIFTAATAIEQWGILVRQQ